MSDCIVRASANAHSSSAIGHSSRKCRHRGGRPAPAQVLHSWKCQMMVWRTPLGAENDRTAAGDLRVYLADVSPRLTRRIRLVDLPSRWAAQRASATTTAGAAVAQP